MSEPFKIALIQTTSRRAPEDNLASIIPRIEAAISDGAAIVFLPETVAMMESDVAELRTKACAETETTMLTALRDLASSTGAWIHAGSMVIAPTGSHGETSPGDDRLANRSFLINADGAIVARYDKIHMFDVELASGERYRESANYRPGDQASLADTPWGKLGMTICYDLRFPALYRTLAQSGAMYFAVPSAFTRPTGVAHWETLLRARAIENGCYVIAAAQCGVHESGRETYGHSLVVDPWGQVIADGGDEPGTLTALLDPARVDQARRQIPSLTHDRDFRTD